MPADRDSGLFEIPMQEDNMASGYYYVNDTAQLNGDHEVHIQGCYWLSIATSTTSLDYQLNCADAVRAARTKYRQSNGCAHCSAECHTS